MKKRFLIIIILLPAVFTLTGESIKVTTWNIEHLGTEGRGFGGGYGGSPVGGTLPARTVNQLDDIAFFIRDTLGSSVLALQEVSVTHEENGESRSLQLERIVGTLGAGWKYYLPPRSENHDDKSMYTAFLWDETRVTRLAAGPMDLPNLRLAGKELFDRMPVLGYFETRYKGGSGNDFLLVNVHLASGQNNDENHLIAMTLIEYGLKEALDSLQIVESDRIILGDFNDNPYAVYPSGSLKHTDALYHHMSRKGYMDYVTGDFHSTRMDDNLTSIIDHILVHRSAARHIIQEDEAEIFLPPGGPESFGLWRATYSDHFPVSVDIRVGRDDDSDWSE